MATSRFENFDSTRETFINWFERFTAHITAETVKEDAKVNYLISCIGADTYAVLKRLSLPKLPSECTFADIKKSLEKHFNPQPLVIVQRFNFRRRFQAENENFNSYLAALRELAATCDFTTPPPVASASTATTASTATNASAATPTYDPDQRLNEELRDQIIQGIRDKDAQSFYLRSPTLTLQQVIDKAIGNESLGQGLIKLSQATSTVAPVLPTAPKDSSSINKINERVQRRQPKNPPNKSKGIRPTPSKEENKDVDVCYRCGRKNHRAPDCRFKDPKCTKCQKVGHFANVCGKSHEEIRAAVLSPRSRVKNIGVAPEQVVVDIFQVKCAQKSFSDTEPPPPKVMIPLLVERKNVLFEADSGSPFTFMSLENCKAFGWENKIRKATRMFQTYTQSTFELVGILPVQVTFQGRSYRKVIRVVKGNYDTLMGRDWIYPLNIDTRKYVPKEDNVTVNQMSDAGNLLAALEKLVEEFSEIFADGIGCVPNVEVSITLKPNAKPIFCHPRPVPYAIRDDVIAAINYLVENKIWFPVQSSDWATPIVPVRKANGSYRLAGDYSVTVNREAVPEFYPIPDIQEIINDFDGCIFFSKFDIRDAYLHLMVTLETSKILTVNTLLGLFRVSRLFFGPQAAPASWQRFIDTLARRIRGCKAFYDDVKISSRTAAEHLARIRQFFEICKENNIRLNRDKCQLLTDELQYLGYRINAKGIHKTTEKIDAIVKAPRPKNLAELKSFTGLVGYYGRFFPNLSEVCHPFNLLSKKGAKFEWNSECEHAFQFIKAEIASERVLIPYSPEKQVILATDASPYAIGAVLSHIDSSGERPIAFTSRTLTSTEERYSQLDKEALGIYWGVRKFFIFLYGRSFILQTDCKPLQAIFAAHAAKPSLSATRLLHYALFLQDFSYTLKFRKSEDHANADFCSRFPYATANSNQIDMPTRICQIQIEALPVTCAEIASATKHDSELSKLYRDLRDGKHRQEPHQFSLHDGCIFRGERVFIPTTLRQRLLKELHNGHLGIEKTKALARSYIYWYKIDHDIENMIKNCVNCQENARNPSKVALCLWKRPEEVWERLHIDFAQVGDNDLLIIVDAFSKWIEVFVVKSTTSMIVIECLNSLFSRFGYPVVIVSDNGPQFVSTEFEDFLKKFGIKHPTSPPFFPASNGQAERAVQIIKRGLLAETQGTISQRLSRFLLAYRRAPHAITRKSPAELFLKRKIRTPLSLVFPSKNLEQETQESKRMFQVGQSVQFRMYRGHERWRKGEITKILGNVMYLIVDSEQRIHKRHTNQIMAVPPLSSTIVLTPALPSTEDPVPSQPSNILTPSQAPLVDTSPSSVDVTPPQNSGRVEIPANVRPVRNRQAPDRFVP